MTRPMMPVLVATMLLAPPFLAGAAAESLPAATPSQKDDGRVAITRSDGSTGFSRTPGAKDIRRLITYMRDGMAHADRADREDRADSSRQTRKTIRRERSRR